jgi:hypothetical protein
MTKRNLGRIRHVLFIVTGILMFDPPAPAQAQETPAVAEAPPVRSEFSIGVGVGVAYGGSLGLNVDLIPIFPERFESLGRYMSLSAGLGVHPDYLLDHSLGFKLHPAGKTGVIQPRFTFQYGLVDIIYDAFGHEDVRGITAGAGMRLRLSERFSTDADLDYVLYAFDSDVEDLSSRAIFSLGLRWHP